MSDKLLQRVYMQHNCVDVKLPSVNMQHLCGHAT